MEIKNLVFDMGNVLIKYNPQVYLEKYIPQKEYHDLVNKEVFKSVEWIATDYGSITLEDAIASCCKRLPEHLHESAYNMFMHWNKDLDFVEGMEDLIKTANSKGYAIYLLSNTSNRYYAFRERITCLKYFDGEFVSCDWQLLKPSKEIYHAFCHHFNLNPAQCVFVDDLAANIFGATQAGMNGIVFFGDVEELKTKLQKFDVVL